MEGQFRNGILIKGTIQQPNGETLQGTFEYGLLQGEGSTSSSTKRSSYIGHFVDGEKHGMGTEIYYKKKNKQDSMHTAHKHGDKVSTCKQENSLASYFGHYSNGDRNGLGTLKFQDTGFRFHDRSTKDFLQLDGPWLGGRPIAGGKITNVESTSSTPTTNKFSSRYRFLNRFKKVEDYKDETIVDELKGICRVDERFRALLESKKKQMFGNTTNHLLCHFDNEKVDSSSDIKVVPKSNITNKKGTAHPPRLGQIIGEQRKPSLKSPAKEVLRTPTSSSTRPPRHLSPRNCIRETRKTIEQKWKEMGCQFEYLTESMNHISNQYNLLEDQWNSISLDVVRDRALEYEQPLKFSQKI